jgi:hypothetical protein
VIKRFHTISGSVYEVDLGNSRCRRLGGKRDPLPRQGEDGQWKEYSSILGPAIGESCIFFWKAPEGGRRQFFPATQTSMVIEIHEIVLN